MFEVVQLWTSASEFRFSVLGLSESVIVKYVLVSAIVEFPIIQKFLIRERWDPQVLFSGIMIALDSKIPKVLIKDVVLQSGHF